MVCECVRTFRIHRRCADPGGNRDGSGVHGVRGGSAEVDAFARNRNERCGCAESVGDRRGHGDRLAGSAGGCDSNGRAGDGDGGAGIDEDGFFGDGAAAEWKAVCPDVGIAGAVSAPGRGCGPDRAGAAANGAAEQRCGDARRSDRERAECFGRASDDPDSAAAEAGRASAAAESSRRGGASCSPGSAPCAAERDLCAEAGRESGVHRFAGASGRDRDSGGGTADGAGSDAGQHPRVHGRRGARCDGCPAESRTARHVAGGDPAGGRGGGWRDDSADRHAGSGAVDRAVPAAVSAIAEIR